jgi:dTDP-4-dehydrorhamnose reductase
VFDGIGTRPWEEDDVPKPLSVYGASKLAGEVAVRSAGGPHLVVRTSWVYAATGRNFLCTIARLAEERTELKVVADQIGAPTSAALIADAVTAILDGGLENLRCRSQQAEGLVNLAATGETSRHGFACSIVAGLRARGVPLAVEKILPIRTEEYPPPARRPRNSRLNLARLNHVFGLRPQSWEAVLAPELDGLARASSTGAGS